jgi:hypothetical protein
MKKKNLFQAVKTFINDTPKGETFTTKELIASVGNQEEQSSWKQWNNNPYYRTHTYKAYLKRTGFLSNPKYGVWEVKNHIPDFINLGTIEFLIGYKTYSNKYNGLTEQQIKDKIEEFNNKEAYSGKSDQDFLKDIENQYRNHQLVMSQSIDKIKYLIEEREDLEKVRILDEIKKEKVMKFDFERGKKQLLEWMDTEFDCSYGYSLQYIKELSTIAEIQKEVESFRRFENSWINKTIDVKKATTMREVFAALEDTAIEDDDNFIIELFTTEE